MVNPFLKKRRRRRKCGAKKKTAAKSATNTGCTEKRPGNKTRNSEKSCESTNVSKNQSKTAKGETTKSKSKVLEKEVHGDIRRSLRMKRKLLKEDNDVSSEVKTLTKKCKLAVDGDSKTQAISLHNTRGKKSLRSKLANDQNTRERNTVVDSTLNSLTHVKINEDEKDGDQVFEGLTAVMKQTLLDIPEIWDFVTRELPTYSGLATIMLPNKLIAIHGSWMTIRNARYQLQKLAGFAVEEESICEEMPVIAGRKKQPKNVTCDKQISSSSSMALTKEVPAATAKTNPSVNDTDVISENNSSSVLCFPKEDNRDKTIEDTTTLNSQNSAKPDLIVNMATTLGNSIDSSVTKDTIPKIKDVNKSSPLETEAGDKNVEDSNLSETTGRDVSPCHHLSKPEETVSGEDTSKQKMEQVTIISKPVIYGKEQALNIATNKSLGSGRANDTLPEPVNSSDLLLRESQSDIAREEASSFNQAPSEPSITDMIVAGLSALENRTGVTFCALHRYICKNYCHAGKEIATTLMLEDSLKTCLNEGIITYAKTSEADITKARFILSNSSGQVLSTGKNKDGKEHDDREDAGSDHILNELSSSECGDEYIVVDEYKFDENELKDNSISSIKKEKDASDDKGWLICADSCCQISDLADDGDVVWVQCENCDKWWHCLCAKLGDLTEEDASKIDFTCQDCARKSSKDDEAKQSDDAVLIDKDGESCSENSVSMHANHPEKTVASKMMWTCYICAEFFPESSLLQAHHSKQHGVLYPGCAVCGNTFETFESMFCHTRFMHGLYIELQCILCKERFEQRNQLLAHLELHVDNHVSPSRCGVCDITSEDRKEMVSHLEYHVYEKLLRCPHCNIKVAGNEQLKIHLKEHVPDTNTQNLTKKT